MGYHRLTRVERYQIEALANSGLSKRAIGQQLGRSPSTICREMHKCEGQYEPEISDALTQRTRRRERPDLHKVKGVLKRHIDRGLMKDWSPEQIVGRMAKENHPLSVSYQTLYRYIERDRLSSGSLWTHLRILRKKRHHKSSNWRPKRLEGRVMIDERPSIVEERSRLGDFERDTVFGRFNGSLLLTIVDRTSRLCRLAWVSRKCSHLIHQKTIECLKGDIVQTLTNDNGCEFAQHLQTSKELGVPIYFSQAYRSWERGSNENFNGLLRQYYPRKRDIGRLTKDELKRIEDQLNHRPRKCLGFKTPYEVHRHLQLEMLR